MLLVGLIAILGALALLFRALGILGSSESAAAERLRRLTEDELVVAGSAKDLSADGGSKDQLRYRITPNAFVERAEHNYMLAGRPEGMSVPKILLMKLLLGSAGLALGVMVASDKGGLMGTLILIGAPLLGYFAPDVILRGRAVRRQEEIQYSLPDLLDQITVSIESGTSFENALARSGQTGTGPLADEVVRTVQDIALGLPRREAYEALVGRTDVEDLRKFVRSILQGEEFGVPVSDIVREQASEMRVSRRLRAEAAANRIPVKMLMPLMATILPVLFIVVIGPAILTVVSQF